MKRYTPDELTEVLRLHRLWMADEEDGSRANLSGSDLSGANLYGSNLSGAYLSGSNLSGSNLSGSDLSGANLYGSNLSGSDLYGVNLSGAYLSGANLSGADLSGAYLYGVNLYGVKVAAIRAFSGLYEYQCQAVISVEGVPWIRMGCLWMSLEDWDSIGIRKSNVNEFPDDGSEKSERRARAFDYVRAEVLVMAEKFKAEQAA